MVPTVDRGLRDVDFWSIDTAGDRPSMKSTSGLSIWPRNCRAYDDKDSTYRRCPSAKIVSKARLDLPEPDRPVNTIIASRGRSRLTSRRLCSRAPRMISRSATASHSVFVVLDSDVSRATLTTGYDKFPRPRCSARHRVHIPADQARRPRSPGPGNRPYLDTADELRRAAEQPGQRVPQRGAVAGPRH